MEITYLGHASFLITTGDSKILFDPFISPNPLASEIKINELMPDFILLSHGHADHTADVETIARQSGATIVANAEIADYYQAKGIGKVIGMNIGGKIFLEFGSVKMVTAIHSSSFGDGTYAGNPGGFVIEAAEKTFYYAGDTALTMDMKLIGEEYNIDFAILPIGDHFTMGITDAVRAADFVGTTKIIGMHFDTFPPISIDKTTAVMTAKRAEKELILMNIGETLPCD